MQLPIQKDSNQNLMIMQNRWKSILDPIIALPQISSSILTGIVLKSGPNTFNHLLGRTMQGWIICDINAAAVIYRSSPLNDKTLTLTTNAPCTVSLEVF